MEFLDRVGQGKKYVDTGCAKSFSAASLAVSDERRKGRKANKCAAEGRFRKGIMAFSDIVQRDASPATRKRRAE